MTQADRDLIIEVLKLLIGLVTPLLTAYVAWKLREVHAMVNGVSHELNEAKEAVSRAQGLEAGRVAGKTELVKDMATGLVSIPPPPRVPGPPQVLTVKPPPEEPIPPGAIEVVIEGTLETKDPNKEGGTNK